MTLEDHQAELRASFVGGGLGAIVSGLVWAVAAVVASKAGIGQGFTALFLGGVLIFPLSLLLARAVFRRAGAPGNPGATIVIETLPGMFFGLFVAWLLIESQPDWVFPIAALAVGAHYFPFRTAYGDILFWLLGGIMMAIGAAAIMTDITIPLGTAGAIAVVEVAFGLVLTVRSLAADRAPKA